MDETTKILIGTISGFIIAFFSEPVKVCFENKSKLNRLRLALYKEVIQNFWVLKGAKDGDGHVRSILIMGQPLLINDCYKYALAQETSLFYQLREARFMNGIYKLIDTVIAIPFGEKTFRGVSPEDTARVIMKMISESLHAGILDKKIAEKASSKKEVQDILSTFENPDGKS